MPSLLEIKKKIGSVKNMRKITKAMQLVAASKMKQFQDRAVSTREHMLALLEVLQRDVGVELGSPLALERSSGKTLFLLYSSDKGLCGSMNAQLGKGLLRSNEWNALDNDQRALITIGRKASDIARVEGIPVIKEFKELKEKFTTVDMLPLVSEIFDLWLSGEYKEIYLVVPYYKNAFTFYPRLKKFLPLTEDTLEALITTSSDEEAVLRKEPLPGYCYLEPSQERLQEVLLREVLTSLFVQSMYELKATEYSSRMMAMQNATDAAGKVIDEKTLVYNKLRQAAITQQISEIVNAAEAIK